MSNISINPMLTTNAKGLFNVNSAGFTQGDALDDPAVKFQLASGFIKSSETLPMWGGLPISEGIVLSTATPSSGVLNGGIARATTVANSTGICVFNQAFQGITTPQSTAPQFTSGMTVNFYRLGSRARIPMRVNPALVSLDGSLVTTDVSYDFTNNWITAYISGTNSVFPVDVLKISTVGNKTISYDSGTGFVNWVYNEYVALVQI
jgi:hypothetical protein